MVATVRCEEIANEKLACFTADEVPYIELRLYYQLNFSHFANEKVASFIADEVPDRIAK